MKKTVALLFAFALATVLVGCGKVKKDPAIKLYTRDITSGTRGGFFSTIGFKEAVSENTLLGDYVEVASNGEMISSIKNDEYGIGYVSLSSLETSGVKGLNINGVAPTEQNVLNKTYTLTRNFNYNVRSEFASKKEQMIVEAFVAFLSTREAKLTIIGASLITGMDSKDPSWETIKTNYPIVKENNSAITIRFGGSTSVETLAKKLSAEFSKKCGNFKVEHNHTGSGDAYKATQGSEKDGANALHVGFASREYKLAGDEPLAASTYGLLCIDAIAAVVNEDNHLNNIKTEQLKSLFDGSITKWSNLN